VSDYHAGEGGSLQLPGSGLIVQGEELIRKRDNAVLGRHRLDEIVEVSIKSEVSVGAIVTAVVLGAGAAAARYFIESVVWGWVVCGVLALFGLIMLLGAKSHSLLVRTRQGDIRYNLVESPEDCQGFVVTLRGMIGRR
jgi:hypothetical protein